MILISRSRQEDKNFLLPALETQKSDKFLISLSLSPHLRSEPSGESRESKVCHAPFTSFRPRTGSPGLPGRGHREDMPDLEELPVGPQDQTAG